MLAYQDALRQGRELAEAIGLRSVPAEIGATAIGQGQLNLHERFEGL
ncbi:MAG: hypothetical protein QUV07_01745 [Cyanobium sp. CZS 25K]|nr:hypothetical protein [Cyanobium sp. CZS25K]